ncbi:MAG: hypothetical protein ACRDNJ_16845, partial [Solirubrobacteraceae bacterium]
MSGFTLAAAAAGALLMLGPAQAAAQVSVFPIPGSHFALPQTQITFRGVAPSVIGTVRVSGSSSGSHAGVLRADSDGDGASFIPKQPFKPGETVTVQTGLSVTGGGNGDFRFTITHPSALLKGGPLPKVAA